MTGQIIYSVRGESDELKAAVASAQATFKFFWRELSWEARRIVKSLDMAAVKMSFVLDATTPTSPPSKTCGSLTSSLTGSPSAVCS